MHLNALSFSHRDVTFDYPSSEGNGGDVLDRKDPTWTRWMDDVDPERPGADGVLTPHTQQEILRDVLGRLPGREAKTLAHLGMSPLVHDRALVDAFGRTIVIVDAAPTDPRGTATPADAFDLAPLRGRVDVLVADGTLARADLAELDRVLDQALRCLNDGGLLAATFPAAPRVGVARELRLRSGATDKDAALHELELQYRLRRAGFHGVRMVRVEAADESEPERLLCLAVRRANN